MAAKIIPKAGLVKSRQR